MLVVVGGGLAVLQSSQDVGPSKLIYLAVAGVAFLGSCWAVWKLQRERRPMFDAGRPWLIVSVVLFGLIGLSLPVALAHGTPLSAWLRDAATYGLFAAAPVFALDAASSRRRGVLLTIIAVVGILGAVSFATNWITLRNIAVLPFSQLVLPTGSLPTILLTVSLGVAIVDRQRRWAWILLAGLALSAFLVSGTRSTLLTLVALPAVVIFAARPLFARSATASLGAGLIAAAIVLAVQASFVSAANQPPRGPGATPPASATPSVKPSPGGPSGTPGVQSPVASTPPAVETSPPAAPTDPPRPPPDPNANIVQRLQEFFASPERDGSIRERVAQYVVAWNLFMANPILGAGLGHPFAWTRLDGSVYSDFTADTPLVLPAKLGILGLAWVAGLALVWVGFVRRLRRTAGVTAIVLAMSVWAVLIIVYAWAGVAVEEKGFSFAVMLMLAVGFVELETAAPAADDGLPMSQS
jgi:O-antigen ligase